MISKGLLSTGIAACSLVIVMRTMLLKHRQFNVVVFFHSFLHAN